MSELAHRVVPAVVRQHVDDAAMLRNIRARLLRAPDLKLRDLLRHDERMAAHLDGVMLAGVHGTKESRAALGSAHKGEIFTAAVQAIITQDNQLLAGLLAFVEAFPPLHGALASAFGWVSATHLQGTIKLLLCSNKPWHRQLGLVTCVMHQVDPGDALEKAVHDEDVALRRHGLRIAGICGRRDLLDMCNLALSDSDASCRFWAANSCALLEGPRRSLASLSEVASQPGAFQERALGLALKMMDTDQIQASLKSFAKSETNLRLMIVGTGVSGDTHYVPWLIRQMGSPVTARQAGEAFALITGVDIGWQRLDCEQPEVHLSGPNNDPDDEDVEIDEDDGLPWPDPVKVQAWWNANQNRFQQGVRYFVGEPVSVLHCIKVLREGYQRQRIAAAEYLCLLQPGTKLFPTSAPAWRQQRWLKQMQS